MRSPSFPVIVRYMPTWTRDADQVGSTVRKLREERGLLVQELAEMAGVTRWTVTNVESGHVQARGRTLYLIAQALDVELSDITGEE